MSQRTRERIECAGSKLEFVDFVGGKNTEHELRSVFAGLLKDRIKALGLTQTEAATFMGIKQPEVSKLVSGRTDGFTLARVFAFVSALGGDVEIEVRAKPVTSGGRVRLHVTREAA